MLRLLPNGENAPDVEQEMELNDLKRKRMNKEEEFVKIGYFIAEWDIYNELYWQEDLTCFIQCNDQFYWGCSDLEELEAADLPLLEECLKIDDCEGPLLYCAKKRKMRPQGAAYQYISKKNWKHFDDCGPPRDSDLGNPIGTKERDKKWSKK